MDKGHTNKAYEADTTETNSTNYNKDNKRLGSYNEKIHISNEYNDDYDPYQHRNIKHPIRASEALVHLLKGSLGTGILSMPNAFKNSGYTVGVVATIIIGLICLYCIHILLRTNYEQSRRKRVPCLTFPELAEYSLANGPKYLRVFAPVIGHVTKGFLIFTQLGTSCVYVMFIASNIKSIVDVHVDNSNHFDIRIYMCMILLPLVLINWIRNLKYLAPATAIGNGTTLISFGIILYYIFREPISTVGKYPAGDIEKFPLFLGTVLFALEAIGVVIPLQNEMRTPKNFGRPVGVLNIAMTIIILLYTSLGFCGYLKYGDKVAETISLNLEPSEIAAQCAKAMLAFAIFVTHALQSYVAIDIIWNDYVKKRLSKNANFNFWEYVVRTSSTLLTFVLAVAIPYLDLFISLIGALCLSVLGLALPAAIQLSTWWYQTQGFARVRLIVINCFVMLVGLIGLVVGTTISIIAIVDKFSEETD